MKSATVTRTATAALLLTSALFAHATPGSHATDVSAASLWSKLWQTPDQRGQTLLQQGDARGAAQIFSDPQHKGHAALQAQDYGGAAKILTGIDTAEAHYNRGNALAHMGDLQGAINAYDAALKHNPQHADARHNRDVVAAELKKQKDDKKDSSKQEKQNDKEKASKDDSKAGDKSNGKNGEKDDKSKAKQGDSKDGKAAPKSGDAPNQKPDDQSNQSPTAKPGKQPASAPQTGKASAPAAPASNPKDDSEQAHRDAEASLGRSALPPVPAAAQSEASAPATKNAVVTDTTMPPQTEKQIAKEQWLRAIPDDPGGLLRRKFLIEHMLRQQEQKP
ncbi:MAG: tetratricopeptide repeat protein [Rhodoferax sp.]